MGKKQVAVSLRKPPPADPDAFVAGGADARSSSSAVSSASPEHVAEGPTVVTRVGERRELTVYLPTALARQLSVRCVELDRDVSGFVADALAKSLAIEDAAPAPAALPAPSSPGLFDRWSRARELVSPGRARELVAQVRARFPLGFGLA